MENTQYKGFTIEFRRKTPARGGDMRYFVNGEAFNPDGYATMNNAKGAITKHLQALEAKSKEQTSTPGFPVRTPLGLKAALSKRSKPATSADTDRATVATAAPVGLAVANDGRTEVLRVESHSRIHASRAQREGYYAGTLNGKPDRRRVGKEHSLCSYRSGLHLPNRKARKAHKLEQRAADQYYASVVN
jgi:hypothetical protein